jgi:pyrophosphatase PpaX
VSAAIETCLFDLDGTLIDSIELILRSYEHALERHGMRRMSRAEITAGLGTPLKAQFAQLTGDAAEVEALIATYRAYNLEHHDALVKPYAGVVEAVNELRARGMRLGIVTSKRGDSARRGLDLCGFNDEFEVIVALDDCARHKPDPEPVRVALERLRVGAATACYVGDSPHDVAAGNAAGVATFAVAWGPFARDAFRGLRIGGWIEQPRQLGRIGAD